MKDKWCKKLLRQTSKRAKKTGMDFNITLEDIKKLWDKNGNKCALTGIYFEEIQKAYIKKQPYIPSLDRINSQKGYIRGNVRIVCCAVNIALHVWGSDVFDQIALYRTKKLRSELDSEEKHALIILNSNQMQSKLLSADDIERKFHLITGWFRERKKRRLIVPAYLCKKKHGNNFWYRYDLNTVKKFFKIYPETLEWRYNSKLKWSK